MTSRAPLIAGVAAVAWALVLAPMYRPPDVEIGTSAGRALLGGDLAVYAHMPEAQMGPAALLLAGGLPRIVYLIAVAGALTVFVALAGRLGVPQRAQLVIGLLVSLPWAMFALEGHADDVLVLLGAAVMLLGLRDHRAGVVVVGFVLAAVGKPTAAVLVGLLVVAGWRATVAGLAFAGAVWAPFILADVHGFVEAGRGVQGVMTWSLPWIFGADLGADYPGWVRPTQLMVGVAMCWWFARRGQPAVGLLLAFAVRTFVEPGTWYAYSTTLAVLAMPLPRGRYPVAVLAVTSYVIAPSWGHVDAVHGVGRLVCLAGIIALLLSRSLRSPVLDPEVATVGGAGDQALDRRGAPLGQRPDSQRAAGQVA